MAVRAVAGDAAPAVRLLDRIVQSRAPLLVARGTQVVRLPGPADYAAAVAACPLRFVLADPLTRVCAALAYAEGDRLAGCLDLVHVPARTLWVEWLDAPRLEAAESAFGPAAGVAGGGPARAGVYIETDASGRRGRSRSFWGPADGDAEVSLAPLVTDFDLDAEHDAVGSIADVFAGASACLTAADAGGAGLLRCLRFRFDEGWAAYYRSECATAQIREQVLRASLATVATDLPLLFALCLLLSSRTRLPERRPDLARLNRRRARAGRVALLDHVELTVPIVSAYSTAAATDAELRRAPRLHHVRGHIVRRGSQVYWRVPHLRGRAAFGNLRARSVTLQFESSGRAPSVARRPDGPVAPARRDHASPLSGGLP